MLAPPHADFGDNVIAVIFGVMFTFVTLVGMAGVAFVFVSAIDWLLPEYWKSASFAERYTKRTKTEARAAQPEKKKYIPQDRLWAAAAKAKEQRHEEHKVMDNRRYYEGARITTERYEEADAVNLTEEIQVLTREALPPLVLEEKPVEVFLTLNPLGGKDTLYLAGLTRNPNDNRLVFTHHKVHALRLQGQSSLEVRAYTKLIQGQGLEPFVVFARPHVAARGIGA